MKANIPVPTSRVTLSICALLALAAPGTLRAQEGPALTSRGEETKMDLPGSFHKYYGQSVTYYKDSERRVAKIDLDGDLNYDGVISNEDPADGGAFEHTPPGLVVGVGELSKVVLRLNPYRIDFQGEVVVTLELAGINRADASGAFASFADEQASVGRIKVWKDSTRTELLLDSADPNMLVKEFVMDATRYPANLPGVVPRTFFVEGVSPSGTYAGDIRLLTTVSHREPGTTPETYAERRKKWFKTFRTSFDHMLFTVRNHPMEKEFINNNAAGVWITPADGFAK